MEEKGFAEYVALYYTVKCERDEVEPIKLVVLAFLLPELIV